MVLGCPDQASIVSRRRAVHPWRPIETGRHNLVRVCQGGGVGTAEASRVPLLNVVNSWTAALPGRRQEAGAASAGEGGALDFAFQLSCEQFLVAAALQREIQDVVLAGAIPNDRATYVSIRGPFARRPMADYLFTEKAKRRDRYAPLCGSAVWKRAFIPISLTHHHKPRSIVSARVIYVTKSTVAPFRSTFDVRLPASSHDRA